MICPPGQIATPVTDGATTNNDGCFDCSAGTYSAGGYVTTCTATNCPAGKIASKTAASDEIDGCIICFIGTFSAGGSATSCSDMVCPAGQIATNVSDGAKDKTDGCSSCQPGS